MNDDRFFEVYARVLQKFVGLGDELDSPEVRREIADALLPLGINVDEFIEKIKHPKSSEAVETTSPELALCCDVFIEEFGKRTPSQIRLYHPVKGRMLWRCKIELVGRFEFESSAMNSFEALCSAFEQFRSLILPLLHSGGKLLDVELAQLVGFEHAALFSTWRGIQTDEKGPGADDSR